MSGGGAKGFTYLGFIKALEEEEIQIDQIYAHSGAALGMCYLNSDLHYKEQIKRAEKFSFRRFPYFNPFRKTGFVNPDKIIKYFTSLTSDKKIQHLKYKTYIGISNLTDIYQPTSVLVEKGNLAKYAVISSIVPPVMPLYRENGKLYGDGAFANLYATQHLRENGAEIVIGLYPDALKDTRLPSFSQDFSYVLKSLVAAKDKYEKENFPVDYEIKDFGIKVGLNEFKKSGEMFDAGYQTGKKNIDKIKELIL